MITFKKTLITIYGRKTNELTKKNWTNNCVVEKDRHLFCGNFLTPWNAIET